MSLYSSSVHSTVSVDHYSTEYLWSERRIRTANGGQDGGDEKVIGDSDISMAREGGGEMGG